MGKSFVQVPPQSTGKKVLTELRKEIYYDGATGVPFFKGNTITGETSLATGVVTAVVTEGFTPNSGELYLKEFTGEFIDNENLQVDNTTVAVVDLSISPQQEFDIQKIVISDPNNPEHTQAIDRFGATVNTFTDGSPVFGPFGTLTTGEPQVIKFYRFLMDNVDVLWYDQTAGGGTITWDPLRTACTLSTGTVAGDFAYRTTNYRHPYVPGVGRTVEFTAQIGDNGKAGLRRRYGYFNENDGCFFEQDGTEIFLVVRSSTSGSPIDTRVPQSEWNLDRADGTDSIGFTLDLTKANMFWIDLQWHGAGRVRFGTYESDGQRIPLHVFGFASNTENYPYMKTASLPLRFEQENLTTVLSPSIMRYASAVVRHSSRAEINGDKHSDISGPIVLADTDGEIPIMSLRPGLTYNGQPNIGIFKGMSVEMANTGTRPVVWRLRVDPSGTQLTGGSWASRGQGAFTEVNKTATSVNTSTTVALVKTIGMPGVNTRIEDNDNRSLHTFETNVAADGATQPTIILTAEVIGTGTAEVFSVINWEEYKL